MFFDNPGEAIYISLVVSIVCLLLIFCLRDYFATSAPLHQASDHSAKQQLVAHQGLLNELYLCVATYKLLELPHARVPERWRQAYLILCADAMSTTFDATGAVARVQTLGFGAEQAQQLVVWRMEQPYSLVTVLLALLTGQPDDEIWTLANKG
jgi:hypothetical protein